MTSQELNDDLQARVLWARTRMLFSHVPFASMLSAGFAVLVVALVNHLQPGGASPLTLTWLVLTLVVAMFRTHHALVYFQSKDRQDPTWRKGVVTFTGLFSTCWALSVWMLPLRGSTELQGIAIGSVAGIAASGAFMLTADRLCGRLWTAPILVSCSIYCATLANAYGLFGVVSLTGFLIILWLESGRSHRRLGELLHLRFESDHIAAARAQALDEAQQLSLAKGRFLATMSHEMRTPLHGILGLSRLLRPELQSQEAHQRLNLLQGAGQHLVGVINDVLDFSRLQSGKLELAPQQVSLWALVRDAMGAAEVSAIEKGVQVSLEAGACENTWVEVDPDRLKQVLHNLLSNAVKFTERGQIHVRLCKTGGLPLGGREWFTLEVEDTGIGIPVHEVSRVFDAFHQTEGRIDRRAPGSGLGLSIARQICLAMQGDLTCESHLGAGSTFRCTLPIKVIPTPSKAMPHVTVGGLGTWPPVVEPKSALCGTVLLVEDNPVNAMVAQAELEQLGLEVATADNGRKALEWLTLHHADLVLMDCHMPEMDGFEATRRIREIESQRGAASVPIIALTASAQVEDRRECLNAGMDDHLAKPFAHGDLVRVVRRHLLRGVRRAAPVVAAQQPQAQPKPTAQSVS